MQTGPQTLWTGEGLECRLVRTVDGFEVSVRAGDYSPFLRRLAHSHGDALNQAEYLRVLLDRTRDGVRKISSRQPLVLIVEDDPDNLFAYETMLRMDGLRTASASSLADARRLLREFQPDAVLLDHMLPDGEGGFMCGELRDSGNGEPLPILLVTGLDPRGLKLGSRDSPDAVLAKPCRPETLTSVLELLVQRRRMAVKSHAARSFRRVRSSACAARSAAPRVRCAPERDAFSARAAAKKARSSLITSSTRSSDWILQPSRFTTDRPYLRFPRPFMAELEPTNVAKRWHLRPWSYTIVENCRARTHRAGRPG